MIQTSNKCKLTQCVRKQTIKGERTASFLIKLILVKLLFCMALLLLLVLGQRKQKLNLRVFPTYKVNFELRRIKDQTIQFYST